MLTNTNTNQAKAAGNTYYVDAADGLDTNDGLTPGTAWKTINKVNTSSFSPGDNVLFQRGETWRETLTFPSSGDTNNPITIGAYGSGNKPIISGANIMQTWTSYAGTTWQKTNVTTSPSMVFRDGVVLTKGSSQDTLNNLEWFWVANVLYVRDDAGDPDTTGVVIEASQRLYGMSINGKDHIEVRNIRFYGETYYSIYISRTGGDVDGITIDSCELGDGGNSSVSYRRLYVVGNTEADRQMSNITISNTAITAAQGGMSITYSENVALENITAHGVGTHFSDTVVISNSNMTNISAQSTDNLTIANNTITGTTTGGAINIEDGGVNADVNNILIENNTISDDTYAGIWSAIDQIGYKLNGLVARNNLIKDCGNTQANGGGILIWYGFQDVEIYKNIIIKSGKSDGTGVAGGIEIVPKTTQVDISGVTIYNNTLYDNYGRQLIVSDGTLKTVKDVSVKNNILYANGEYTYVVSSNVAAEVTNTFNYNLHYRTVSSGNMIKWAGTDYTGDQWSDFITASSQEANSKNPSNPLFVSAATDDFSLTSTSPAIDAGLSTGAPTTDYAGKQRYDDPDVTNTGSGTYPYYDIGAYEYVLPPDPTFTSTSHPSHSTWYSNTNVDMSLTSNGSSTTYYRYLVSEDPSPNKSDILNGTLSTTSSFTATIPSSGQWYIYILAVNLDNEPSTNYYSYGVKIDTNGSNIYGPTVIFNNNSATVSWTTNESSTSRVDYGFTDNYNSMQEDTNMVTEHHVGLTDLMPCHEYHYRVYSKDSSGNDRFSTDNTFTTEGCPAPLDTGSWRYFSGAYATSASQGTSSTSSTSQGIPSTGTMDSSIRFDATNLFPGKSINKYLWDFGDGKTDEGRIVNHKYSSPNRYTVKVTGYDKDGNEYVFEQTIDISPEVPTIKNIKQTNDTDLIIEGNGYKGDTIYLSIHSTPMELTSSVDDTGYWSYTIANASEVLGEGEHTVTAIDSFKLADNTELKSSPTDDTKFKVYVEDGKLNVEMEKSSRYKVFIYVLIGLIVAMIAVYFIRRRTHNS